MPHACPHTAHARHVSTRECTGVCRHTQGWSRLLRRLRASSTRTVWNLPEPVRVAHNTRALGPLPQWAQAPDNSGHLSPVPLQPAARHRRPCLVARPRRTRLSLLSPDPAQEPRLLVPKPCGHGSCPATARPPGWAPRTVAQASRAVCSRRLPGPQVRGGCRGPSSS